MRRSSDYQILFKCCHKVDKNKKGYMFDGLYIDNISGYLWQKIDEWKRLGIAKSKYELISVLCDIKRKQKDKWHIFMRQPKIEQHPFKKQFTLILSDIEPPMPYIQWNVLDMTFYETYYKK